MANCIEINLDRCWGKCSRYNDYIGMEKALFFVFS